MSRQSAHEGGKVVSPRHRPPLPPGNIPGTHFCQRLSQPQGHTAAVRISHVVLYCRTCVATTSLPPTPSRRPRTSSLLKNKQGRQRTYNVTLTGPRNVYTTSLIFTDDNFMCFVCFTRTHMNNQSDTVVNWLSEQFVTLYALANFRGNKFNK